MKLTRRYHAAASILTLLVCASQAHAFAVYGLIGEKWRKLGAERSPVGAPVTDELDAVNGRYNDFQFGSIYWKKGTREAFAVYGEIAGKWKAMGRERGLGYPLNDESPAAGGGRYNAFDKGAFIFFKPGIGAKAVYGVIAQKWVSMGRETSFLGYPTTDEFGVGNAGCRASQFEGGIVYWSPIDGAKPFSGLPSGRVLNPSVIVNTQKHQLGGWVKISGSNFVPNATVSVYADNLPRRTAPYTLGGTRTDANGNFSGYVYDARCWSGADGWVVIRVVDQTTGVATTGTTSAFHCN